MASPQASPQIRCHALELLGRVLRGKDLDAAREAFKAGLATANTRTGLAVGRAGCLHRLGTIDMFDDARTDRLSQARRIAGELGADSTAAVIDLQLTAVAMFRFELGEAEVVTPIPGWPLAPGSGWPRRVPLRCFSSPVQALRRDRAGMDRFLALAHAAEPGDPEIEGSALAGAHGMLALLADDRAGVSRASAAASPSSTSCPSKVQPLTVLYGRCYWPRTATQLRVAAIGRARRIGLTANRINKGILGYADAILVGRAGDQHQATELAVTADSELRHYPVWADLARLCAAESALTDAWGQPRQWLETAADTFLSHGIEPLALRCRQLVEQPQPSRWSG